MILPGELEYKPLFIRPSTNAIATAVVEYICYTHVLIRITEVNGSPTIPVQGAVYREDALYGIKDEHRLADLFSPGDTLYGRILSLGSTGPVVVSTADPAHGVIIAVDFKTQKKIPIQNNKLVHEGTVLKRKIAQL